MKNFLKKIFLFLIIFVCFFSLSSQEIFATCDSSCSRPPDCTISSCNTCDECVPTPNPQTGGKKDLGTFEGLGPLGGENNPLTTKEAAASTFTKFISTTIGILTIVAFIWFIFVLFSGAIAWLSSGGDKQKLQNAQKQITTALTGLLIVISAIFLMKLVEVFFGINILGLTELITGLK